MAKQNKNNMTINMTINNSGEIIIYGGADGVPRIEVRMQGETVWPNIQKL